LENIFQQKLLIFIFYNVTLIPNSFFKTECHISSHQIIFICLKPLEVNLFQFSFNLVLRLLVGLLLSSCQIRQNCVQSIKIFMSSKRLQYKYLFFGKLHKTQVGRQALYHNVGIVEVHEPDFQWARGSNIGKLL
jgi:hypothetical protein